MIQCALCMYAGNPDTATNCVKCKTPLAHRASTLTDDSYPPQRGETVSEDYRPPVSSRRQTVAEGMPPAIPEPFRPSEPSRSPGPSRPAEGGAPPRWSDSGSNDQAQRRRTVYVGTPADEAVAPAARTPQGPPVGAVRKIIGVLITYSWKEEGQIFPVFQGRNYIGTDPNCEICVPNDATLSGINTSISYRLQFLISDKDSMSGTDLDGQPVFTDPVPLRNYASIRTGSTYWTFVVIHPTAPSAGSSPSGEVAAGA